MTVKESLALLDEARERKDWKEADRIRAILNCQYFQKVSTGEEESKMVPNPAYMDLVTGNAPIYESYVKDREREFEKAGLPKGDWIKFFENGAYLITD